MATLEEENLQLRDMWHSEPALPPEWGLTRYEHRFVMALYRKRGVIIDRHRLLTAMYGAAPNVKPDIVNTFACTARKKLRAIDTPVQIESFGMGFQNGFWISAAGIHEIDYLLEESTKPTPYRRTQ